jgi:glycine/D-amino acid oxidase-like deaminating enzyme
LLLAPVIAQTMADLVTSGKTPDLIAPFNIARFSGEFVAGRIPGA